MKSAIRFPLLLRKRKVALPSEDKPTTSPLELRVVVTMPVPMRVRRETSTTILGRAPRHTNQMSS